MIEDEKNSDRFYIKTVNLTSFNLFNTLKAKKMHYLEDKYKKLVDSLSHLTYIYIYIHIFQSRKWTGASSKTLLSKQVSDSVILQEYAILKI